VLFHVFEARRKANRPGLAYCGDDEGTKETAATLIRDVGFDPTDAGPLRIARYIEPFSLLIGQLACEGTRVRSSRIASNDSGSDAERALGNRIEPVRTSCATQCKA
jgi:predicted dinucleotide-binding enzyme